MLHARQQGWGPRFLPTLPCRGLCVCVCVGGGGGLVGVKHCLLVVITSFAPSKPTSRPEEAKISRGRWWRLQKAPLSPDEVVLAPKLEPSCGKVSFPPTLGLFC